MSERFDYIAIGPKGVYALCEDRPGCSDVREFIADVIQRGHVIERVPVPEAVRRHIEYLDAIGFGVPAALGAGQAEGEG